MTDQIYAQRGTNAKVTVNAAHKNSSGTTVYFTNANGITKHSGLNKFKKLHYHLSGPMIPIK